MLLTDLDGGLDGVSLSLPDDLLWSDEHCWSPAVSSVSYLLGGALLVQSALRQAGRPITLVGAADMGWVPRGTVTVLRDWAAIPLSATAGRFRLVLQGARTFIVAFRHTEIAVDSEPVTGFPARGDLDYYRITIRLMEI